MSPKKVEAHRKLEALERWSAHATLTILAGIAIELALLIIFPPEQPWLIVGGVVANTLIGIGLIIEYIVILRAIVATGKVQRESDERVAEASARAAQADAHAAAANERAARLETEAAQARVEQERLKAIVAWRTITPEQHAILVQALTGLSITVWVTSVRDDPEARMFRDALDQTLKSAGATTKFFVGYEIAVGLTISPTPVGPERDALITAFIRAGLPLSAKAGDRVGPPNELELTVGTKPPP